MICGACKEDKTSEDFNKDRTSKTGFDWRCRACRRKYDHSIAGRAAIARATEKRRSDGGHAKRNAYRQRTRERYRGVERRHSAKRRILYPEKTLAQQILHRALRKGEIIKPSVCNVCGEKERLARDGRTLLQAHHHNGYDKPFDVKWLCVWCHSKEHINATSRTR